MKKTFYKRLKYLIGDLVINLFISFVPPVSRALSPEAFFMIARVVGGMGFYYKKYRKRVEENLLIAFGKEKDHNEIKRLTQEVFFNNALIPFETIYAYTNQHERFFLKMKIQGKENLDSALAKGNGVIALGAHLGPFTLLGGRLALEGYSVNVIINQNNFPILMNRLDYHQRRIGQKIFHPKPITSSIKKSLNCLHRNEILYLIADEQQRGGGIPVPFFGQRVFTPAGPAIFSLKTGAPILPMFVLRGHGIERTLVIGTPVTIDRTSHERMDVELLTAKFTKTIEETIRQFPSQWAWLNRRWKLPHQETALDSRARGG